MSNGRLDVIRSVKPNFAVAWPPSWLAVPRSVVRNVLSRDFRVDRKTER